MLEREVRVVDPRAVPNWLTEEQKRIREVKEGSFRRLERFKGKGLPKFIMYTGGHFINVQEGSLLAANGTVEPDSNWKRDQETITEAVETTYKRLRRENRRVVKPTVHVHGVNKEIYSYTRRSEKELDITELFTGEKHSFVVGGEFVELTLQRQGEDRRLFSYQINDGVKGCVSTSPHDVFKDMPDSIQTALLDRVTAA